MNDMFYAILVSMLRILILSAVATALIQLEASLAVKVLICCGVVFLFALVKILHEISYSLVKILHWQRSAFIAAEMNRLDPDNLRPTQDIILDDKNIEKQREDFNHVMGGGYVIPVIGWAVFIATIGISTWFMLQKWHLYA